MAIYAEPTSFWLILVASSMTVRLCTRKVNYGENMRKTTLNECFSCFLLWCNGKNMVYLQQKRFI